ncbi:MAG: Cof-type HAD-IIB family hydrolase [Candidatus Muiribacteriaceae bacterium]
MDYKAAVLDMDGTTLRSDYTISDRTLSVIRKVQLNGAKVIIATGRMYSSVLPFYRQMGLVTPVIAYNGARIYSCAGECIYKKELGVPFMRFVIDKLRVDKLEDNGITPLFFPEDRLAVFSRGSNVREYESRTGEKAELLDPGAIFPNTKIIFSGLNYDYLQYIKREAEENFGKEVYLTNSMARYVEMLHPAVSKGNAVRFVLAREKILPEHTVVIGDNNNDIKMFEPEFLKIAVGNASEQLKDKADIVADSNDRDGVAQVLEKIFLKGAKL